VYTTLSSCHRPVVPSDTHDRACARDEDRMYDRPGWVGYIPVHSNARSIIGLFPFIAPCLGPGFSQWILEGVQVFLCVHRVFIFKDTGSSPTSQSYPDPSPVIPLPESLAAQGPYVRLPCPGLAARARNVSRLPPPGLLQSPML